MKFAMTFLIDVYEFESERESRVLTTPGDYIRMKGWASANMPEDGEADETVDDIRKNYAIVWHSLKRRGKLGDYGLPDELDLAAVDAMADRFAVYVNTVEDGQLPLKEGRGK